MLHLRVIHVFVQAFRRPRPRRWLRVKRRCRRWPRAVLRHL